jgi:PIN domain nuclease of toxin-antitoxin system
MRLLLDTHILIWAMNEPTRLGEETRSLLRDAENEIFFSAGSIWEVAIKAQLGRGFFAASAGDVSSYARASGFAELPVLSAAAERVESLPLPRSHAHWQQPWSPDLTRIKLSRWTR